LMIKGVKESS